MFRISESRNHFFYDATRIRILKDCYSNKYLQAYCYDSQILRYVMDKMEFHAYASILFGVDAD